MPCYCQERLENPKVAALMQNLPEGFCGLCDICQKPGHSRAHPHLPFSGAWCDEHWQEVINQGSLKSGKPAIKMNHVFAYALALAAFLAGMVFWVNGLRNVKTTLHSLTWKRLPAVASHVEVVERFIMKVQVRKIFHHDVFASYSFDWNGKTITEKDPILMRTFSAGHEAIAYGEKKGSPLIILVHPKKPWLHRPLATTQWQLQKQMESFVFGLFFFLGAFVALAAKEGTGSKETLHATMKRFQPSHHNLAGLVMLLLFGAIFLKRFDLVGIALVYGLFSGITSGFFSASGQKKISTTSEIASMALALVCAGLYGVGLIQRFF